MSAATSPLTPSPQMPERPRRRYGAPLTALAVVVMVALFAAVFALLRQSGGQSPTSVVLVGGQVPTTWVTYRDPAGYFTIRVPVQWRVWVGTGSGSAGDRNGSFSYTSEDITIGTNESVLLGTGVAIDMSTIPNAFARQWYCASLYQPINTTLAGLPASGGMEGGTWLLDTQAAHYQISTPFSPHTLPAMSAPATPVPQATVTATQHLIALVVSTFHPIPDTPLKC